MRLVALILSLVLLCSCAKSPDPTSYSFTIVEQHPTPILTRTSPGAENNKYGFEGGRVIFHDGAYHLFISEMISDPKWTKTQLAHWSSKGGSTFTRHSTLFESTGDFTGQDPRAALFLPIPIFDESIDRWTLFYSAFKSAPNKPGRWLINHEGRIHRALSQTAGPGGIGGPYKDENIVLQPGPHSDPWEGLQGTDSFFPFKVVDQKWLAFYGSAQTQNVPTTFWGNGLTSSDSLAGPWRRLTHLNPVLHPRSENPHVLKLRKNLYAAVFDALFEQPPDCYKIGYTFSADGLHWTEPKYIQLSPGDPKWIKHVRTPVSFIPQGNDSFLIFFTATHQNGYSSLSRLTIKLNQM